MLRPGLDLVHVNTRATLRPRLKRVMTEMAVIDEQIRASDDKAAQLRHDQLSAAKKSKEAAETAETTRRSLAVKEATEARDTLRRRLEAWAGK